MTLAEDELTGQPPEEIIQRWHRKYELSDDPVLCFFVFANHEACEQIISLVTEKFGFSSKDTLSITAPDDWHIDSALWKILEEMVALPEDGILVRVNSLIETVDKRRLPEAIEPSWIRLRLIHDIVQAFIDTPHESQLLPWLRENRKRIVTLFCMSCTTSESFELLLESYSFSSKAKNIGGAICLEPKVG